VDAHDAGQLKFFNTHAGLADKRTFKRFIAPLRRIQWVVHCKACGLCNVPLTLNRGSCTRP
jgi:hypothetical protein